MNKTRYDIYDRIYNSILYYIEISHRSHKIKKTSGKIMRKYVFFLLLFLFFSQNILLVHCSSGEFDKIAVVEWVIDGDTFDTSEGDRIRLADINTPEENNSGYWEATNYMISTIKNKSVYLDIDDKYTYDQEGRGDRLVCVVYVEYNQTHYLNVNKALLENNLAVIWEHDNQFNPYTWDLFVLKSTIPEFPSQIILTLCIITTLLIIIYKRKLMVDAQTTK